MLFFFTIDLNYISMVLRAFFLHLDFDIFLLLDLSYFFCRIDLLKLLPSRKYDIFVNLHANNKYKYLYHNQFTTLSDEN